MCLQTLTFEVGIGTHTYVTDVELSEVNDLDLVRRLQNLTFEVGIRPHNYVTNVRPVVRSG